MKTSKAWIHENCRFAADLGPQKFFTPDRVKGRTPDKIPPILFHWTQDDRAIKILQSGGLKGNKISLTENPALSGPGNIGFVIMPQCLISKGFKLWPYLWGESYANEAEWVVAGGDSKMVDMGGWFHIDARQQIVIPLDCVRKIGIIGNARRSGELIALAQSMGVQIDPGFDWTDYWSGQGVKDPTETTTPNAPAPLQAPPPES